MNKLIMVSVLSLVFTTAHAKEYLEKVESEVVEMSATKQEIFSKAKSCVAEHVSFDGTIIRDAAGSNMSAFFNPLTSGSSSTIQGGQVLTFADIDTGKIVANSRVDYGGMMTSSNAQSRLTLVIKEGRFKLRHTAIKQLSKSTGYTKNNGYIPVGMWWGAGSSAVKTALEGVSTKVINCITGIKVADMEEEEEW